MTQRFFSEEEAQVTVEYVLLLAVAVVFVVLVMRQLVIPAFQKLGAAISRMFEKIFPLDEEAFHRFRIKTD